MCEGAAHGAFEHGPPDLDALDSERLKALVIEKHALTVEQSDEIERLKLFVAKLQRMQFGPSSERLARQIDQLALRLEDLETNKPSLRPPAPEPTGAAAQPARKPL